MLGSISLFELFTWYGWNVNSCFEGDGDIVLSDAFDYEDLLLWLLDHGCEPNMGANPYKDTAIPHTGISIFNTSGHTLNMAAGDGNISAFDILLRNGAKLEKCSALHIAAAAGRIPMMKHLLALDMDVDGPDKQRRAYHGRPLFSAIDAGSVQFLLKNGAVPRGK